MRPISSALVAVTILFAQSVGISRHSWADVEAPLSFPLPENQWTEPEKLAWSCIRKGLEVNFDREDCAVPRARARHKLVKRMEPGCRSNAYEAALSATRTLRSRFLETIIGSEKYSKRVGPVGYRLIGAVFRENINLENININSSLVLDDSIFWNRLSLDGARADKNISLDGALICGTLSMKRARIGGELFMRRGHFRNFEANDIEIDKGITIERSVFFHMFLIDRSKIGKLFYANRAFLTNFVAKGALFDGDIAFTNGAIRCHVALSGSNINGSLTIVNTEFGDNKSDENYYRWSPTRIQEGLNDEMDRFDNFSRYITELDEYQRFNANNTNMDRSLQPCERNILFERASVAGSVCWNNVNPFPHVRGEPRNLAISLDATRVVGALVINWDQKDTSDNIWLFTNMNLGWLYSDLRNWPNRYRIIDTIYDNMSFLKKKCDGFLHQTASGETDYTEDGTVDLPAATDAWSWFSKGVLDAKEVTVSTVESVVTLLHNWLGVTSDTSPSRVQLANSLHEVGEAALQRVPTWLKNSEPRSTQPFVSAIEALNKAKVDTRIISVALEDFKSKTDALSPLQVFFQAIYRATVRYGYYPLNIIWWVLGAVLLFWAMLRYFEGPIEVKQDGEVRVVRPGFIFSVDNFIPVAKLDEINYKIRLRHPFTRRYLRVHKALGYIFSFFLLAGLSKLAV